MKKHDLRIELLGTRIVITADEDPAYLVELLDYYRSLVTETQKKTGLRDPLKVAILTGYQLCDEIMRIRKSQSLKDTEEDEAARITQSILSRIDAVVKGEE